MTEFRPTRFEILPSVIKNLIIINVLFFIAQNTIGRQGAFNMEDLFALHHVRSPLFKPWQIITHMFLHANIGHIFWNMLVLWMFGSVLENLWGPKRFLTFYFLCGIGAAILHLTFLWYDYHTLINDFYYLKMHPSTQLLYSFYTTHSIADGTAAELVNRALQSPSDLNYLDKAVAYTSEMVNQTISFPTVGASGAIMGVFAAFVYLFPNTFLYVYFFIPVKAKWLGLIYFGFEIFQALQNNHDDNIARWAHIGGALVGFLLVITWNKNRKRFY